MKSSYEFRERLKLDLDFKKKFEEIKSADEAIKLAAENGYDLTNCSKQEEKQLTEDMLENVAGGKNKTTITVKDNLPNNVIKVIDPNNPNKYTLIPI